MSYFHTGICTIIGADAFHCPVRDGKEWYHVAMVIRHNGLSRQFAAKQAHYLDEFIESSSAVFLTAPRTGIHNKESCSCFLLLSDAGHVVMTHTLKVIGSSLTSN